MQLPPTLQLTYVTGADGNRHLTIPEDIRQTIIKFVRETAARPPTEIERVVQEGHDEVMAELQDVSDAQAQHKPAPDSWSILELMAHVVTVKQVAPTLCRSLGEGQRPPGFNEEWEEEARQDGVTVVRFDTLSDARTAAEKWHQELLPLIRNLDGVNTETRFKHFVFGAFNSREWPVFQRVHDADHTPQLRAIKASPGFPAA